MKPSRSLLASVGLVLCLLTSGCLDYSEMLTLNPDGSGKLQIDFTLDMGYMEQISKALGDEPDPDELRGPTREEVVEGLEVDGITIDKVDIDHKGRKSRVHVELSFEDLQALRRIEGFGDDRKLEFFDEGDGKHARVVYSFDTTDVIPVDEVSDEEAAAAQDPTEKKILDITRRAREALRFRARVLMPGRVVKSNGMPDRTEPRASLWRIDKATTPDKHSQLGRGKIYMMMLVEKTSIPFALADLKPLPDEDPKKQ
jgi:hypothetical protein